MLFGILNAVVCADAAAAPIAMAMDGVRRGSGGAVRCGAAGGGTYVALWRAPFEVDPPAMMFVCD